MKVWHVYVSNRLGPVNGVVQSIHRLAEAQRAFGLEVEVLHGTEDDPLMVPTCGSGRGLARQLRRSTTAAPPDVVHLHELFRPPHLVLRSLLATTPFVLSTHGATAPSNLARYRWRKTVYGTLVERRVLRGASALVALTDAEAAEVRSWWPSGPRVWTVGNVADPELLAAEPWRPGRGRRARLVSLSRWDVRHKGLDRAAALAELLPEADLAVHGTRCGNEGRRLDDLLATAPPNLQLLPPVRGDDRVAALRSADGFVLLSRWEGLSMALLEAMALGVVCFVSPEVAATIGDRSTCIVVPHDPAAAAAIVAEVLADPARAAVVGAEARRWVEHHAAAEVVGAASAELYATVTGHRAGRRALVGA